MSTAPAAKKMKTSGGPPLYSRVDLSKLTICDKPVGSEIRHATVTYGGSDRFTFQLSDATSSLRVPFGVDDGSRYGSKASLVFELPAEQLAFIQDGIEAAVKAAAVRNKALWFSGIKPLPSDDAVRNGLNSRIKTDDSGKYPPSLKVNICLTKGQKHVLVHSTTREANGRISRPRCDSVDSVVRGCRVLPILRTAGGVWMTVNAKKKTFEYGLVFEASELLVVVEESGGGSCSMNFEGVEVASDTDEVEPSLEA